MSKRIKILQFFDNESGRDVEMMIPLLFFAEEILNCEVKLAFVLDYHAIYREKPDLVIVPNMIGSHLYLDAAKYAKDSGIPVFALESEGNFGNFDTFNPWSINKEKKVYQDYWCCWSERVAGYFRKEIPVDKVVVTGGTYFDQYLNYEFVSKADFLKKQQLKDYNRIITYAGWAFGSLAFERGRKTFANWLGGEDRLPLMEMKRAEVEGILEEAIINNPDTLFILKKHPKEVFQTEDESLVVNEMVNLDKYENVFYTGTESAIRDLISVSDIWLSFESTTALESWLSTTPTCMLRGTGEFSERYKESKFHLAQPVVNTGNELDNLIKEFYRNGELKEFLENDKKEARQSIIKNSIGFGDGFNHIRAGYYLSNTIDRIKEGSQAVKVKFKLWYFTLYVLIILGKFFFINSIYKQFKFTRKFIWVFTEYDLKKAKRAQNEYYLYLHKLYKEHGIRSLFDTGKLSNFLGIDNERTIKKG